jgi:hypothetical protein
VAGDLGGGFLSPDQRPKIDQKLQRGLPGLRKILGRDDCPDPNIDVEEIVKGDPGR